MELPQPQKFPHTPQNSMLLESSSAAMVAPTPPPSAHPTPAEPRKIHQAAANAQSHAPAMPAPVQHAPGQHPPPVAWQQSRMMQAPPHHHHQAQHMMPPATMPRIYCNPHPKAPPISAQQLASKYMTARDISYVVHSMLKALLSAPTDHEADYQYQLLCRTGLSPPIQHAQQPDAYKNKADILEELLSRQKKAQEWSSEKHTLGHVLKTNALRPRALIAPTVASVSVDHDSSNKQRASLWKARIYCDQAYQAYANVLECWRTAAPGQVPAFTVQVHLERLLKCFGMTSATEVDAAPLALLLKLRKGRVLVTRVLEQALVPPVAVRTLLPLLLQTLMATPPPKDDIASDDRLCLALARVLATVPELTTHDLVNSARAVLRHGSLALSSESRMHCVHALLQRGSVSQQTEEWSQVEAEFMQLLGGL
ncbi:hypothetical protein MPSEU_000732700 [Mayamaea pseudoterrestris]|nr:hypothetical protein MPSEU_000732700 [Mayamaea pseudoterrestris]